MIQEESPALVNKKTDSFRTGQERVINLYVPLKTTDQLDIIVKRFTTVIQSAVWNNTPVLPHKTIGVNYTVEIRNRDKRNRCLR